MNHLERRSCFSHRLERLGWQFDLRVTDSELKWMSPSSSPADQMERTTNRLKCVKSSPTPPGSSDDRYVTSMAICLILGRRKRPLSLILLWRCVWSPDANSMLMYAYVPRLPSWVLPRCHISLAKCFLRGCGGIQLPRPAGSQQWCCVEGGPN